MPGRIQAGIVHKGGHTKYRTVLRLTLLDVTQFQIVLYYAFREMNLYNMVWRPNKVMVSILFFKLSGLIFLQMTVCGRIKTSM